VGAMTVCVRNLMNLHTSSDVLIYNTWKIWTSVFMVLSWRNTYVTFIYSIFLSLQWQTSL
jgi:hypothetical protein